MNINFIDIPFFEIIKKIKRESKELLMLFNLSWKKIIQLKESNHRAMMFDIKDKKMIDFENKGIYKRETYWNDLVKMSKYYPEVNTYFINEMSFISSIHEIEKEINNIDTLEKYENFKNKIEKILSIIIDLKLIINTNNLFFEYIEEYNGEINVEDELDLIEELEQLFYNLSFNIQSISNECVIPFDTKDISNQLSFRLLIYQITKEQIFNFKVFLNTEKQSYNIKILSDLLNNYALNQNEISSYLNYEKNKRLKNVINNDDDIEIFIGDKNEIKYHKHMELLWLKKLFEQLSLNMEELNRKLMELTLNKKQYFELLTKQNQTIIYRLLANDIVDNIEYINKQLSQCKALIENDGHIFKEESKEIKIKQAPSYLPDDKQNEINQYIKNNINMIAKRFEVESILKLSFENDFLNKISFETTIFKNEMDKYRYLLNKMEQYQSIDKTLFVIVNDDDFNKKLNDISKEISLFLKELNETNDKILNNLIYFKNNIDMYDKLTDDIQPFEDLIEMLS